MILYLDTSSLVKLYVEEKYSDDVRQWVEEAEIIATSRVAYPEMISALNRRHRAGDIPKRDYSQLTSNFEEEWSAFVVLDFDERAAGRLADKHGLRGFDAIHLSSAKFLKARLKDLPVLFSSFDDELNRAASAEKMTVLLPEQ